MNLRLLLANDTRGVDLYSFDTNGTLTFLDNDYQSADSRDVVVDPINKICFAAEEGNGIVVRNYDASTLTLIPNTGTLIPSNSIGVAIDSTNKRIALTDIDDGLYYYRYDNNGILNYNYERHPHLGIGRTAVFDISNKLLFYVEDSSLFIDIYNYNIGNYKYYIAAGSDKTSWVDITNELNDSGVNINGFRANKSSTLELTDNVEFNISANVEEYDQNNTYNNTTYIKTIEKDGEYTFSASADVILVSAGIIEVYIKVGTTIIEKKSSYFNAAGTYTVSMSTNGLFSNGNEITAYVKQISGAAATLNSGNLSNFKGVRITK